MNIYAWSIDYCNRRGEYAYTAKGIMKADSEEEALDELWNRKGSERAYNPHVEQLDKESIFIEF